MTVLLTGLILFVLIHIFTATPSLRGLLARPGKERLYQAGFGVLVILCMGLIIYGKSIAPFEPVWEPPLWGRHLAWLLVLVAFVLLATAHGPTLVRQYVPHPMLMGVLIWAIAHLTANGDMASMMLFGTFAVFSVLMMILTGRRGAAKPAPQGRWSNTLIQAVAGAALYGAVLLAHPYLFGVPALA